MESRRVLVWGRHFRRLRENRTAMAAVYRGAVVEVSRSRAIDKFTKAVVELDATHIIELA